MSQQKPLPHRNTLREHMTQKQLDYLHYLKRDYARKNKSATIQSLNNKRRPTNGKTRPN